MKKKMAILLLGIIAAVAVLAGCGGKKEAGSPVVGDYKLASVESGGMTVDVDEYKEMMGDDSLDMSISIKSDGTFSIDAAGQSGEGTWEYKEPVCTLTIDGEPQECQYEDGVLTMDFSGVKMNIEK